MENTITTPLGTLYILPNKNEDTQYLIKNKLYFDKLFVYHERYLDENNDTIDIIGMVSQARYGNKDTELTKTRVTDIGSFLELFDNTFSINDTEYIKLSGLLDYLTFCKFGTSTVDINRAPTSTENKVNIKYNLDKLLLDNIRKDYIDYMGLSDIVKIEFIDYIEEIKGEIERYEEENKVMFVRELFHITFNTTLRIKFITKTDPDEVGISHFDKENNYIYNSVFEVPAEFSNKKVLLWKIEKDTDNEPVLILYVQ